MAGPSFEQRYSDLPGVGEDGLRYQFTNIGLASPSECARTDSNTRLPGFHSDTQAVDLDIQDLFETVVPFINHRRTLLNSLTIASSSAMDLSDFFKALPLMPALRRFAARIYFDRSCLQDVSGILQILETHSEILLHVELRPNPANDQAQNLSEKQFDFPRLNELLLTSPATLCGLESLEIPYVSLAKTIRLLCRSRNKLTYLCLTDRFLTKDEVTEVVGIFSHRPFEMQHFHIQVEILDGKLIYMLARRLPGLFSLVLVYHKPYPRLPIFRSPTKVAKTTLLGWKLCCLSVYAVRYQPSPPDTSPPRSAFFVEELDIMQRISTLVPSINCWKGYSKCKLSNIQMNFGSMSVR